MSDDANTLIQRELDHHLAFFKRRHEIENEYAESLKKLVQKAEPLDDRSVLPPSWRKTSTLVRAEASEEAMAHATRARELEGLVKKLTTIKEDKDRGRRRVKEDSRTARDAHVEYLTVVERLKRNYERKVEDVQAHERDEQERDREHERDSSVGSSSGAWPPEHWSGSETSGKATADSTSRPRTSSTASSRGDAETPPALHGSPPHSVPVFVSGAGSTGSQAPSAYREPPTGKPNVFEAIAKRDWSGEKHRINSLARAVGNLAKGGEQKDGGVGVGGNRDYRDGVWRLETLRLQRARVAAAARIFLIDFTNELSFALKEVLDVHASSLYHLGNAMIRNGEAVRLASENLQPAREVNDFAHSLRPQASEPRVYYKNYFVGECRDLLFGVSLIDYHATHPETLVPLVVKHCISFVDGHGLTQEGIYRISGKQSTVQQLVHQVELKETAFRFDAREEVSTAAGLLKLYLRQLPVCLFPFATSDRMSFSSDILKDYESAMNGLLRRIRRLPPPNFATLKALVEHLARVVEHEPTNKMTAANLGVIFSPVVFHSDADEAVTIESAMTNSKDLVMEVLIAQHIFLFNALPTDGRLSRAPSDSANRILSPPPSIQSAQEHDPHPQQVHDRLLHIQQHTPNDQPLQPPPAQFERPALTPSSSADAYELDPNRQGHASDPLQPPITASGITAKGSGDSVYQLYQDSTSVLLPTQEPVASPLPTRIHSRAASVTPAQSLSHSRSTSFDHNLSTPSPPLSAAGGRHVPVEGSTQLA